MQVTDFIAFTKKFYNPPKHQFMLVTLPRMRYLMVEGKGNPDNQDFEAIIKWLYAVVHVSKPAAKKIMGKQIAYPPVEFQFWAQNPKDFANGNKNKWYWRVMIICADFMPADVIHDAVAKVEQKLGALPSEARLDYVDEGKCVQYLHVGDYSGVANVCEKLYGEYLPQQDLKPSGFYHEIYLGDPNRVSPAKRKIIIRQPVA